ncbi:unnamed protein product [Rotaria sordida]|uniref:F-box domain-containing protein n=1 Tax=Rotaria sordida TaxID=392033 RepID=A0A815BI15_9BILA|nr:unnamed protein product [Rotaria sordida]CAF1550009.1 unnamed protein product [Rotaria sordida]
MSDIRGIMKFELLPNEILFIFFEYLNIFDIFYSFDQLNNRFSKFIRNIRFQLNFENVQKTLFDKFCTKIELNPEIKNQIYSLKLSDKETCGQINAFLSIFSFNEFSYLKSLTLVDVEKQNIRKLKTELPQLSKLIFFHMICQIFEDNEILNILPMFNLRTLSILSLHSIQTSINNTSNIINLTIHICSLEHLLYYLFKYFPMLKYLNIKFISRHNHSIKNDNSLINKYNGIHLKQLIIGLFKYNFEDLEIFVKQIPNLKSLTIHSKNDINMINADKWKNLIQSSLTHLNIFKFKFSCNRKHNDKFILEMFQHFQDDFWCKQHQWYTECLFEKFLASIYTIPYVLNRYKLELNINRFSNKLINNSNIFDKVFYLTLDDKIITDKCQYHFSNIDSLRLFTSEMNQNPIDIYYLKMIVNLSNLKHLDMFMYKKIISSKELLEILKQTPKLSTITINPINLKLLFNDNELCKYFNKMIKKLHIDNKQFNLSLNNLNQSKNFQPSFNNHNELKKFCEIFSNIEQLICYISESEDILFLLNQLTKLSTMKVYLPSLGGHDYFSTLFRRESSRLNFIFRVRGIHANAPELSMWIGRNQLIMY